MIKSTKILNNGTQFFIPAAAYQAVNMARSKEETRYYLCGVFLHNTGSGLCLVATDGHILLKYDLPAAAFVGDQVTDDQLKDDTAGAILNFDVMEKAFKAKIHGDNELWIYGDTATGIAEFVTVEHHGRAEYPRVGVTEFDIVDGSYPDYRRVIPSTFSDDAGVFAFDPDLIAIFSKARKFVSPEKRAAISIKPSEEFAPALIEFSQAPELIGVLMPMRMT